MAKHKYSQKFVTKPLSSQRLQRELQKTAADESARTGSVKGFPGNVSTSFKDVMKRGQGGFSDREIQKGVEVYFSEAVANISDNKNLGKEVLKEIGRCAVWPEKKL